MGIFIFILGLCVGSFVNMLVYRTAKKYGLIKGAGERRPYNKNRSVCDFCGKQLSWFDNVPVVSWLWLKGKSRCCGKKLPFSYPIVEVLMGILFLITNYELRIIPQGDLLRVANYWMLGINLIVVTLLMFSAVFDLKYMILPDFSSYSLIAIAILGLWFKDNKWQYLLAGLVSYVFFWLLAKIRIKGKQAMGEGDAPLAAFIGLWLGWPLVLVAFYIAFIIGAVVGGGMLLTKKLRGDSPIPFGPFLILGVISAWWVGPSIIKLLLYN